jgi:hypothetical protein
MECATLAVHTFGRRLFFEVPKRSPAFLAWGFVALWATLVVAVGMSARAEPFAYIAYSNRPWPKHRLV